jgi:hypothetical protein
MYILYVCVSRYVKICQGHVAIAPSTSQLEGCVAQERLDLGRGRRPSTTRPGHPGRPGRHLPRHTATVHEDQIPQILVKPR